MLTLIEIAMARRRLCSMTAACEARMRTWMAMAVGQGCVASSSRRTHSALPDSRA